MGQPCKQPANATLTTKQLPTRCERCRDSSEVSHFTRKFPPPIAYNTCVYDFLETLP
eukprot:NODE_7029_length_270_cov_182.054299_g6416_i0.p1 GENE.NODE_7029_length_270_cov_182.054299_g6416_i0~~NODE_7029_length_270_cov_182.054299_g6416_i0.p1  ORF type:complete len:57 (+),score=3.21 NODE_7029_length_270_cov_182.054299_g6416_i0:31-201(+)